MRIGMKRRLRITYAFWEALGAKNHNTVRAVVHENGFANISSAKLPDAALMAIESVVESIEKESVERGYDRGTGSSAGDRGG